MFLGMLNGYQQNAFLALAQRVVMADCVIDPAEAALLEIRMAEMGGQTASPPSEIYEMPNLGLFDNHQSRSIVLMELYVLAYSDSSLHPEEIPILEELEEIFRFSKEEIAAMRDWARGQTPFSLSGWEIIKERKVNPPC